jgi:hypothetical protein
MFGIALIRRQKAGLSDQSCHILASFLVMRRILRRLLLTNLEQQGLHPLNMGAEELDRLIHVSIPNGIENGQMFFDGVFHPAIDLSQRDH